MRLLPASSKRLTPLLALLVAASLSGAPAAHAAIYQANSTLEFTTALASAALSGEPDTINLGPGTFDGQFTYSGASAVEIVGSGPALTIVTTSSGFGILLTGSGDGHRIANLGVRIDGGMTVYGISAGTPSALIEDVSVSQTAGTNIFGIRTLGVGAEVRRASVSGAFSRAFQIAGGSATLSDITATGSSMGNGVEVDATGATATVRRARITNMSRAAKASFSGALTITDSLLDVRGVASARALDANDNNNNATHTANLTAERVTIVGDGTNNSAASVTAGSMNEPDDMSITLRDAIVTGITTPLRCTENGSGAAATITVEGASIGSGTSNTCADGPGDPGITTTNVTTAEPGYVDPAGGDFRLRWNSPLLDLGTTVPGAGLSDLGGLERVVDGDGNATAAPDYGAFEYQRRAPVIDSATASPTSAGVGEAVTFSAAASDPDPLEGALLTFAWSFDDGGAATGASPAHAFATAGTHTGTVTVTDPSGRSAQQQVAVDVASPPPSAPPPAPPEPAPGPAPTPTPTLTPVSATKAVVIPSNKRCVSRRLFRIRLRVPAGVTVRDASVSLQGKRVRVVKGRGLSAPIDLRGLPAGRFTVSVKLRLADGRTVSRKRTYKTCAAKRRAAR